MASIPGKVESQRRFTQLPMIERRAILKSVNRGQEVENRQHAAMAVWIARRQARFWAYAWLIGPVIGVVQYLLGNTVRQVLINAGASTVFLILLAAFWLRRARRAEALNLAIAEGQKQRRRRPDPTPTDDVGQRTNPLAALKGRFTRRGSTSSDGSTAPTRATSAGGHLPGEQPGRTPKRPAAGAGEAQDAGRTPPPGQRPYRPRGRKRR